MGSRGRKPRSEIVASDAGSTSAVVEREARPEPPEELTHEQAEEWRAIVDSLPAQRFPREIEGLLSAYCRHRVASRHIGQTIEDYLERADEALDFDQYDKLLRMQERESRILASLAVRLGIAYSTAYEKRKQKVTPTAKPWSFRPGAGGAPEKKK